MSSALQEGSLPLSRQDRHNWKLNHSTTRLSAGSGQGLCKEFPGRGATSHGLCLQEGFGKTEGWHERSQSVGSLPYGTNTSCTSRVHVLHTSPLLQTHKRTDPGACTLLDQSLAKLAPSLHRPGHVIFVAPPVTATSNKVRAGRSHPSAPAQTDRDRLGQSSKGSQWVRWPMSPSRW